MSFTSIKIGDTGEKVTQLNTMLAAVGYPIMNIGESFDIRTKASIMAFQTDTGIKTTGIADEETWNSLKEQYKQKLSKTINIESVEVNASINNISAPDTVITPSWENTYDAPSKPAEELVDQQIHDDGNSTSEDNSKENHDIAERELHECDNSSGDNNACEVPVTDKNHSGDSRDDYICKICEMPAVDEGQISETPARDEGLISDTPATDRGMINEPPAEDEEQIGDAPATDKSPKNLWINKAGEWIISENPATDQGEIGESITDRGIISDKPAVYEGDDEEKADTAAPQDTHMTPTTEEQVLSEGSTGEAVKELQAKLKAMGYYNGELDGIFGIKTADALIRFKFSRKLPANGIADRETLEIIDKAYLDLAEKPNSEDNYPSLDRFEYGIDALPLSAENFPTLSPGDRDVFVEVLERYLVDLGYLDRDITGMFDDELQSAVAEFKKDINLPDTSTVDTEVWRALQTAGEHQVSILKESDTGDNVEMLQSKLSSLGLFSGDINGLFDSPTVVAVKSFQAALGISPDGTVDSALWNRLFKASDNEIYRPVIKRGDTGPYVEELQNMLRRLDDYSGNLSGIFDGETEHSLMNFQRRRDIEPTGTADRKTWYVLYGLSHPEIM